MMDEDRAAIREIFSQRLKLLRTRRRISRPALSELCGLGKDAVRRYEKAESFPIVESVCALADFFSVSTDYLLGMSNEKKPAPSSLSPTEGALIHLYRSLPAERQELLMEQARFYQCLEQKQGRVKKKE